MLELENVCDSTLESNRDSAFNQLGRIITCYCKGTCRRNYRFAVLSARYRKINMKSVEAQ